MGSSLVAATPNDRIQLSTDAGLTWQPSGSPVTNWFRIASSADGNKLVACGGLSDANGSFVYTSSDAGAVWKVANTPSTVSKWEWADLASSADGNKLVVVGSGNGAPIYTSADSGFSWTLTSAPEVAGGWSSVASSADGAKLVVAGGLSSGSPIYSSIDSGTTWKLNDAPQRTWSSVASSADGNRLAAVVFYNGGIYTSQSTSTVPLRITLEAATPVVSWSTSAVGVGLQQSSDLSGTEWVNVTNNLAILGSEYQTVGGLEKTRFFRLHAGSPGGGPTGLPGTLLADLSVPVEADAMTVESMDLGGHQLTIFGRSELDFKELTGTAESRLLVAGPGTVTVNNSASADLFRGVLEISGGELRPSVAFVSRAKSIELEGGILTLPTDALLASSAPLRLSGGIVAVRGAHGELGDLGLSGGATLLLEGSANALSFASASSLTDPPGQLLIQGWRGTSGASGTGTRILVKTAPTAAWLARITFVGVALGSGALRLPSGELVPLPKGLPVIPTNAVHALRGYGTGLSTTIGAVAGQVFAEALQINTSQKPAQVYNSGVNLVTSDAVAAGDNLLARFWIRRTAPEPGTARVQFNFEKASGDFAKSVQTVVTLNDDQWRLQTIKFKSAAAFPAGAAEISLWAGYGVQTVEVGGVEVLNYRGVTPP